MIARTPLKLVSGTIEEAGAWAETLSGELPAPEVGLVRNALDWVTPQLHDGQHGDGQPMLGHVLGAAAILQELKVDGECLAAGLLMHVPDSRENAAEIRARFGARVADLAQGAARMATIESLGSRAAQGDRDEHMAQLESLRKMLLAMAQDVRVVLLKLADHAQQLRFCAKSQDEALRRRVGRLALDIFSPLANRLGVWQLKWEIEDLGLRALEPDTYKRIAGLIDEKRVDRESYIDEISAALSVELANAGVKGDVSGRPKHIYSIYTKMTRKGVAFDALYDVRAVRVLVSSVRDCYAALGVVHNLWTPLPKEFDDYIAKPKSNGYRSLHTAVIGPEGKPVEIQIRTLEMHRHAELGVAAHWRYKEGGAHDDKYTDKISWLRQVVDWREQVADSGELAEQFKSALFEDTIYVLTPQGKVIDLPRDATPVDFAYRLHTDVGHRCRGAKVDGVMVPLNTPLRNGQWVEILPAKHGGPSRDWLNPALRYLKSHNARSKVRQWFNRQNYETAVTQGRELLEKELRRHGATGTSLEKLSRQFKYEKLDDFLAAVGRNEVGPRQIENALHEAPAAAAPVEAQALAPKPARAKAEGGGVLVVGVDKLLTVPAKCCKPAPPDPIVGFVTRGRGVTVHRKSCSNVARLAAERLVAADWGQSRAGATFPVDVAIEALERTALQREISDVLSREKINVTAMQSATRDRSVHMLVTVEIGNLEQLSRVLSLVREVRGVVRAARR